MDVHLMARTIPTNDMLDKITVLFEIHVNGCLPTHATKSVQLIVVNLYTSQHIDL
jgi:hypothetical protein